MQNSKQYDIQTVKNIFKPQGLPVPKNPNRSKNAHKVLRMSRSPTAQSKNIEAFINRQQQYGLRSTQLEQTHKKIIERNQKRHIDSHSHLNNYGFSSRQSTDYKRQETSQSQFDQNRDLYTAQLPQRKMEGLVPTGDSNSRSEQTSLERRNIQSKKQVINMNFQRAKSALLNDNPDMIDNQKHGQDNWMMAHPSLEIQRVAYKDSARESGMSPKQSNLTYNNAYPEAKPVDNQIRNQKMKYEIEKNPFMSPNEVQQDIIPAQFIATDTPDNKEETLLRPFTLANTIQQTPESRNFAYDSSQMARVVQSKSMKSPDQNMEQLPLPLVENFKMELSPNTEQEQTLISDVNMKLKNLMIDEQLESEEQQENIFKNKQLFTKEIYKDEFFIIDDSIDENSQRNQQKMEPIARKNFSFPIQNQNFINNQITPNVFVRQNTGNVNSNMQPIFDELIEHEIKSEMMDRPTLEDTRHGFEAKAECTFEDISQGLSYTEQVFTELLCNPNSDNNYCIDCGWKLLDQAQCFPLTKGLTNQYEKLYSIYVSLNHGIFMCSNCAGIHQEHYGVEVSFVKPIIDKHARVVNLDTEDQSQSMLIDELGNWTFTQLKVLLIAGGNNAFSEYMDLFDLMDEKVQTRYSTMAAQYYRDHLKLKVSGESNKKGLMMQQPDYENGRQRFNNHMKITRQVVRYKNLDQRQILQDLMKLKKGTNLTEEYALYLADIENENVEKVQHFQQLCKHEREILQNTKYHKNLDEIADYKRQVMTEINEFLPPFFKPKFVDVKQLIASQSQFASKNLVDQSCNEERIIEPYSEQEDYLAKDDFSNILNTLEKFAGKTGRGLLNLSDNIINQINAKARKIKKNTPLRKTEKTGTTGYVPGHTSNMPTGSSTDKERYMDQQAFSEIHSNRMSDLRMIQQQQQERRSQHYQGSNQYNMRQGQNKQDYKKYIKENAPKAISRLQFLGRNVMNNLGIFTAQGGGNVDSSGSDNQSGAAIVDDSS